MGSIRHTAMLLLMCKSLRDAVTPVHSKIQEPTTAEKRYQGK